ncbi:MULTISPECIES: metallophosphoesterase [Pseudomonas]|jgi:cytolysin (calcineurin-like family phosphatase)|uniref:metallophosphoesterase family protein n=1 Tax=Pseudomonas TaxID=286 RepID=UPI00048545B3|nr:MULTISPECIES: metallophosphoesterase [Pseudomonas]MBF6038107.1 metallophosphoesterase [Pseudomonas mucoides]CRL47877.1 hypothetical protein PSHI_09170 [Pseudomonas sp. URMO17WK12:I11]
MKLLTKSGFIVGLMMASIASYAAYVPSIINPEFAVFTSDPQYPWTDKTDAGVEESDSEQQARSRTLIESQYSDIAHFRKSRPWMEVPVMINGDITAYGHGWQRSYIRSVQKKYFGSDFVYGLGNHDYENLDCFSASCAAGSITDFEEHHRDKVGSFDLKISGPFFNKLYSGSLAWSRDVGDVHFVQLNNEPTYSDRISHPLNPTTFEITDSLDWLEQDLKTARAKGQIILLNMHKPGYWKGDSEQVTRFRKIIADNKVTAVFAGHLHEDAGGFQGGYYFGDVPLFLSGAASQQTYLIASFSQDRKSMTVDLVKGNHWPSRTFVATVAVR